ncbi:hypothetical protein [Variovorax rhizosphaerae]|uniref:CopG family transcriptional regulator n=1 Tax=Variovorax rhizosphaerae TaxID=1836200 RepID=A0ABU8WSK5_9BURK
MTKKLRADLTSDEKALLRHGRALGSTSAIAFLRREVERHHGAGQQPHDEGRDATVEGVRERHLEPALSPGGGYVTK